jgi:NADH dehydrogenase (ubiquinone) 1 beta subcomplex subunit 8
MFSPYEYTHTPPGLGALQLLTFVGVVFGLCGVVSMFYPDRPSAPREFEGGLQEELGGPGVKRVCGSFILLSHETLTPD